MGEKDLARGVRRPPSFGSAVGNRRPSRVSIEHGIGITVSARIYNCKSSYAHWKK
jgi:hypothetical protein